MIAELPVSLRVGGTERKIRSDYRAALDIFVAFNDEELTLKEKNIVMVCILYEDEVAPEDFNEAAEKAVWFLNCGDSIKSNTDMRVYDWEQDRNMIFAAVNKVCGREVREEKYMHFWTFCSFFMEIGDSLFGNVVAIRDKKNKRKKLEDYEQAFYRENRDLVDLKRKYDMERQKEMDAITKQLK